MSSHILCDTRQGWVSDNENNLALKDMEGNTLHILSNDLCDCNSVTGNGSHTVNCEGELIRNITLKTIQR